MVQHIFSYYLLQGKSLDWFESTRRKVRVEKHREMLLTLIKRLRGIPLSAFRPVVLNKEKSGSATFTLFKGGLESLEGL